MIDKRDGETKKQPKSQDSYFKDAPKMPTNNVQPSQRKAPKPTCHD